MKRISNEEIWERFMALNESKMVDVAERATGCLKIFKMDKLSDIFTEIFNNDWLGMDRVVRILKNSEKCGDFSLDNFWGCLDEGEEIILSFDELEEIMEEYETDIIYGILDDDELMDELGLVEIEEED